MSVLNRIKKWIAGSRRNGGLFVVTVVLPTLAAGAYYGLIASDVYISESRFLVRNPQRPNPTGLGALLQGTSLSRSQEESYAVQDFMLSRDALQQLDKQLALRKAFTHDGVDLFNRFPGLGWDNSFEAFHRYYQDHVSISYDSASSISVLRVYGFTAEQSRDVNEALLVMAENLVNHLNARSREDLIEVARREVDEAEARAQTAGAAVAQFRSKGQVFDPNVQSAQTILAASKIREELLESESLVAQIRKVSPNSPQLPALQSRVDDLRRMLAVETGRVTGGGQSMSAQAPTYERLHLNKTFADQQLAAALGNLETARREAARKQLYLERLVQPNLPDQAMEPRRLRGFFTVLLLGLMVYGVLSLVLSSVREHMD